RGAAVDAGPGRGQPAQSCRGGPTRAVRGRVRGRRGTWSPGGGSRGRGGAGGGGPGDAPGVRGRVQPCRRIALRKRPGGAPYARRNACPNAKADVYPIRSATASTGRSVSRRFSALLGQPPMAYVTWWRLSSAGR